MPLRTPPLRELHADRGATFTEFGGWDMPVEFDSIRTEHAAVRESAGLFDVSHMGEILVSGPDATTLTDRLVTNDVAALDAGEAVYAAITDEDGVMHDDTVVYRLPADETDRAAAAAPAYLFVPNAGHDEWAHGRWCDSRDEWGLDATVENVTDDWAMFALQGPAALDHLAAATDATPDPGRFEIVGATVAGVECLVARTGYTGEDGVELLVPWAGAGTVWTAFTGPVAAADDTEGEEPADGSAGDDRVQPCGLFVVKLDTEFVGRDALEGAEAEGVGEQFVGIRLVERGVPRNGYDITNTDGKVIGSVTSGTMSPTLDEPVGMGYVPAEYADPGTTVRVVVRGQQKKARVRTLPFLDE